MATSPPLSPVVATPLGHRKRRHSEMARDGLDRNTVEELTGQSTLMNQVVDTTVNAENHQMSQQNDNIEQQNEAGDDGDDDDEVEIGDDLLEDILDSAEMEPYRPKDENETPAITEEAATKLREHLLKVGLERFYDDVVLSDEIDPAALGTIFGLSPLLHEQVGDEIFLRILGYAMARYLRKRQKLPQYNTIDDAARLLKSSSKIIVITGAGISTSLGIPDFRSKTTGFYSKLQAAGFSEPEEVFDIHEFDADPTTFYSLVHGILPEEKKFSPTHGFIRLLQDQGKLLTNYTQNIDNIEERAGIEADRLIQCHGSFATAICRKCNFTVKGSHIFPDILAQRVPRCQRCIETITAMEAAPKKRVKPNTSRPFDNDDDDDSADDDIPVPGVMKPGITFFGEQLPSAFFDRVTEQDSKQVDLVVVIGTSLKVAPVSDIPNYLPHEVPHIYISREPVEHVNFDIQLLGDCDSVVFELCRRAGWDLKHDMIPNGYEVDVGPVEGKDHRWTVTTKQCASEMGGQTAAENGVAAAHAIAHSLPGSLPSNADDSAHCLANVALTKAAENAE